MTVSAKPRSVTNTGMGSGTPLTFTPMATLVVSTSATSGSWRTWSSAAFGMRKLLALST